MEVSDGDISDSHGDFLSAPSAVSDSSYTSANGSANGSESDSGSDVHVPAPAPRSSSHVSSSLPLSSSSSSCNSGCDYCYDSNFNGGPSHLQSIDTRASLYAKTTRPSTEHVSNSATSFGIQPESPSFDTLASMYSKLSHAAKSKSKSKAKFKEYKAKAKADGDGYDCVALTGVRSPSHSSASPSKTGNSSQFSTPPPRPPPPPFSLSSLSSPPDSTPVPPLSSKFTKGTSEPETIPEDFELFADLINRESTPYGSNDDTCLSPAQEYHLKMQRQQLELQLLQRQKQKLIEQQQQIDQKLQISNWNLCQSQPSTSIDTQTLQPQQQSQQSQPEKQRPQSTITAYEPLNLVANDPLPLPPYTQKKGKIRDSDRPAVQLYNEQLKDGKIKYSCEYYSAYVYDIGDSFDTVFYNRGFATGGRIGVENWFGYGKDADGGSIGFKV
ncbi:unnamed protein product [Ambrosiozyma monospora]|uniref:Unnamed protein product n=1 Tax=Ambrosiozyma monospora TaxID=43982 RepID=A0A9W6Z859_AMBMO|nr:unnamed protein product [Ambrosiozyma monospora]